MYTKKQKFEVYTIFLLIVYVIQIFTVLVSQKGTIALYTTYHRPEWALPIHWLIPTWFVLYTLSGIAGAKIWIKRRSIIRQYAISSWVVVMILNILWPVTFFYIPLPILTPILITILFIALVVLLFNSFLVSRPAGYLMIPLSFMMLYKLLFHWILFILNIQLM